MSPRPPVATLGRVRLPAGAIAVVVTAVAGAGCGQSETPGPAALVPKDSIIYGQVTLDPEGDQEKAVTELAARFPGGDDLAQQIEKGLTQTLREDGLDYSKDVKPWLGGEAVFFVSEAGEDKFEGAAVMETKDGDAALQTFEKADDGKAKKRSYEDTDVFVDGGTSYAVVDDFAVIGSEDGVKAAIDSSQEGADTIEDSDRTMEALGRLDDPLAAVYIDGRRFFTSLGGAQAELAAPFLKAFDEPYVVGFKAEPDAVVVDSTIPRAVSTFLLPLALGSGTEALEALPEDAWFAAGQPEIGKALEQVLDLVMESGTFGADAAEGFKAATGLDLREDVLSWMGDLTVFSRGTSMADLAAGAAIQTSDPAASRRALAAARRLIARQASGRERVLPLSLAGGGDGFTLDSPDLPRPVHVAVRGEKVVIAYGDDAANDLFDPRDTLGEDDDFRAASDRLGEGFTTANYIDIVPILRLAENEGAAEHPDYEKARPYLEPFTRAVAGTKEDGDVVISRTRIEVR